MNIQNLLNAFNKYARYGIDKPILTGKYNVKQSDDIRRALRFWEAVRNLPKIIDLQKHQLVEEGVEMSVDAWIDATKEVRSEFLKTYTTDNKRYISIIAMLESLPTLVFRRVLWYYNIDFSSFESFLRRLTKEQIKGIRETYEALYGPNGPHMPMCFTEGWQNKIRQFVGSSRLRVNDLLNTQQESHSRYDTKGSIIFEFFGLEMGFGRYTDESADEEIPIHKAEKFLSKWHKPTMLEVAEYMVGSTKDSDFVVNREDGLYHGLYVSARSNYVWFPDRNVQIKSAICPGFWITILLWTFFLFISPIASISAIGVFASSGDFWLGISLAVVGIFTPATLLAGGIKYAFFASLPYVTNLLSQTKEVKIDKKYWKEIRELFSIYVFGSFVVIVIMVIWTGLYAWCYESIALATYLTIFIVLYVTHMIHYDKLILPTTLPIIGIPTTVFVFAKAVFDYYEFIADTVVNIVGFLVSLFMSLIDLLVNSIVENWLLILIMGVPLLILMGMIVGMVMINKCEFWCGDSDKVDKYYRLAERIFITSACMTVIAPVTFCVYVFYAQDFVLGNNFIDSLFSLSWGRLVAGVLVFLAIPLVMYLMNKHYKPKEILKTYKIRQSLIVQEPYVKDSRKEFYDKLLLNEWIRSLKNPQKEIQIITNFVDDVFGLEFGKTRYPVEILDINKAGFDQIGGYHNDEMLFYYAKRECLLYMLQGLSFNEAKEKISANKKIKEEKNRKWNTLYEKTIGRFFGFVSSMWNGLKKQTHKAWQIMYVYHKAFNERCPYVAEPKKLS